MIKEPETFTVAICDDENSCKDYEVICQEGEVVNTTPITGQIIKYSPSWQDPRTQKELELLCK